VQTALPLIKNAFEGTKTMKKIAWLLLLIAGCTAPPTIVMEYQDGKLARTEVTGVSGAVDPATISADGMTISTGAGQGIDMAMAALSDTLNWVSIILILGGIGVLIFSAWVPMLPRSTSIILIAAGGVLLAFPVLLDRYSFIVFAGLAGLACLFLYGMWDNKRKLQAEPKEK
tara:strand:- start:534 stop:1049 length:516 start_codon:yes stop_codon:yes gene_type:complete